MKNIVVIFIFMATFKVFNNLAKLIKAITFKKKYMRLIQGKGGDLKTYRYAYKKLLKDVGIEDVGVKRPKYIAPDKAIIEDISVINSFPNTDIEHANITYAFLSEAIGVYRSRLFESFSLSYWANAVIFLPQRIIEYLGGNPNDVSTKILNLIWWTIGGIWTLFSSAFAERLLDFISTL